MRERLGLGHGDDRAGRPARRAARAAEEAAPRATRSRTRTWCACSARTCIDPAAPNPSVETLLHAFLPHAFVDHTHSTAVLSLTDQPDGEKLCEEVYGKRLGYVPYIMPGFALAKAAADAFERDRAVEGLILHKHGIFTFGADAREAYERMIEHVTLAEERLKRGRKTLAMAKLPAQIASRAEVAPIIRGACALKDETVEGAWTRLILDFRTNDAILNFVNGAELARYSQAGVVTPDHTIRTKNWPLIVPAPQAGKLDDFSRRRARRGRELHRRSTGPTSTPTTRASAASRSRSIRCRAWCWCRGSGSIGLGRSRKDARVAADLAEAAIETIADAEAIGRFESLPEADLFDMEYWSLEQAKLGAAKPLAARRPDRGGDRRGRRDRRRDREGLRGGGRRGRAARRELRARRKRRRRPSAAPRCSAMSPTRTRSTAPSRPSSKPSAGSTSSCRTRAPRRRRARSARSTKPRSARASS